MNSIDVYVSMQDTAYIRSGDMVFQYFCITNDQLRTEVWFLCCSGTVLLLQSISSLW